MRQQPRLYKFQSQTRSQSPGDLLGQFGVVPRTIGFNRRREANPLATTYRISIIEIHFCFNRRREANPLATWTCCRLLFSYIPVSIADAKPIPWRLTHLRKANQQNTSFNRRREANPLATYSQTSQAPGLSEFQSQTRSQSPGDFIFDRH